LENCKERAIDINAEAAKQVLNCRESSRTFMPCQPDIETNTRVPVLPWIIWLVPVVALGTATTFSKEVFVIDM
jgi:hypothetical protein